MDKYKTNSAFFKWFSAIHLEKLPNTIRKKIQDFDLYRKKLTVEKLLPLFLYAVYNEKESLRDIDTSFVSEDLQREIGFKSISHCKLLRTLNTLDSEILWAIFTQLVAQVRNTLPATKRNSLYLIDSSTFSLNKTLYPWADFRQSKSGIKLHLKLCFMDKDHVYPNDFKVTHAKEHDDHSLECFVNKPEATYVFDRGYLNYKHLVKMNETGYFFIRR